jgi:outer membrane protein assembly factor BamB
LDSRLRAIDRDTHEERWSVGAENWFWTEPLVMDGEVYAGSLDGRVYAVNAASGEEHWPLPFSTQSPIRSAPVVAGGVLVVVDRDGAVYGIDLSSGGSAVPEWPLELGSDVLADPLVMPRVGAEGKDEVVIVTTGGELVRVDPTTLEEVGSRVDLGN